MLCNFSNATLNMITTLKNYLIYANIEVLKKLWLLLKNKVEKYSQLN